MEISAALLFEGNIESLDFTLAGACSQHDTAAQRHLLWRSQCGQPAFDLRLVMERNGKPLTDLTTDCNAVSSMRVMAVTEIIVRTSIEFDAVYLGSRALPRSGHSRRSHYLAQGRGKNLSKGRWKKSVAAGVPEEIIMRIAGWKTSSVFKRYAIVDKSDIRTALQQLEQTRQKQADTLHAVCQ
jgi:hypothetical protein